MFRISIALLAAAVVLVDAANAELVHYYSFDRGAADDAVGSMDGTINGNPTFEPGPSGDAGDRAIQLNDEGTGIHDDFISFEPNEFGEEFSITAWIQPNGEQDHQMMAIATNTHGGFAGPDGFKWVVHQWNIYDESLRLETGDTVGGTNDGAAGIIFEDEWHHVGIAFDKAALTYEMFYNGLSIRSGAILEFGDDHPWQIGAFRSPPDGSPPNAGFIGLIDDVALFDHVLTEAEVTDLFENGVELPDGIAGDFDGDGMLTSMDIDLLTAEVFAGSNDLFFDLNNDSNVDEADRGIWVGDLKNTYFGDANLDGQFNTNDLVVVLAAGEYEDTVPLNSLWATGDWNADLEFTSGDLVTALADGGYEQGPKAAAAAVPEPNAVPLLLMALTGFVVNPSFRRHVGAAKGRSSAANGCCRRRRVEGRR